MPYLQHITLDTGHSRASSREEVDAAVLDVVAPWLDRALLVDNPLRSPPIAVPVPELAEFSAHVYPSPGGLVMSVYGPDTLTVPPAALTPVPLATFGVARRSRGAAKLWGVLLKAAPALRAPPDMPGTPWLAVVRYPSLQAFPDAAGWLGDFERCVAWAWIDRVAD